MDNVTAEHERLKQDRLRTHNWKRWGTYLSERQWGTVREDYSDGGNSWQYFPHDMSRSRAYRWGEDGLLGWTDRECRVCFSFTFWNEKDPILKERLFGLTGPEGNHGEDVKECYYYLDATPTNSYAKGLYKYPHQRFPYRELVDSSLHRGRDSAEFELLDTGIFTEGYYFDCEIEYAKASSNDILMQLTVHNRSSLKAPLHILPTLWFRNTWSWGCEHEGCWPKPNVRLLEDGQRCYVNHSTLEPFYFAVDQPPNNNGSNWLFTENETNQQLLFGTSNSTPYVKDAFHRFLVDGEQGAVNPAQTGTKTACHLAYDFEPGESRTIRVRLVEEPELQEDLFADFDAIMTQRRSEADEFYEHRSREVTDKAKRELQRTSDAGLLWSKQFYHYSVADWLDGDPEGPQVSEHRKFVRNSNWRHLYNRDVISMPDKWEYPWYAAWDSAFHMIPFADLDPEFAKDQLVLFLREWYMHPNGQIPAYEWALDDVNPPVHAWACWEVYQRTSRKNNGFPESKDKIFLARAFHKLLLNFTWWVNRKDVAGRNLFSGGFLGLDNIGIFDRSKPLPTGGVLEQADGTAWMAFYASSMLTIAMELADGNPAYGDMASKFFEHFISISVAMNTLDGTGLWDEEDGFYYDHLRVNNKSTPMKIRSLVGLIPLITATVLEDEQVNRLPGFKRRMDWYLNNHSEFGTWMNYLPHDNLDVEHGRRLLSVPSQERLRRMLNYMLDEEEFLSPFGIRSLSRVHLEQPYVFELDGQEHRVSYVSGESDTWMFGGNSNWRGPIWFPLNFLIVQSLRRYHRYYGNEFLIECPTGSGNMMNLSQVADEIRNRLIRLFEVQGTKGRPCHGGDPVYQKDQNWKDLVLFYEYFDGDSGRGCGASHQTGWTSLVSTLLDPPLIETC